MLSELPKLPDPSPQLPKEPEDDVYRMRTSFVLTTAAELAVPAAPAGPAGPWEPVSPGVPKTVEVSLPEHFFTDASRITPQRGIKAP